MSVLLFMPKSGGNPLESIIMTTDGDNDNLNADLATMSRFEFKNGKPVRKLSTDSASLDLKNNGNGNDNGIGSAAEGNPSNIHSHNHNQNHQQLDDVSSLGEDDSQQSSSSASSSFKRKPLTRNVSAKTANSNRTPQPHHHTVIGVAIADAKQPQLRLSPVGAIFGATTPAVVKAVNKAQERRILRTQSANNSSTLEPLRAIDLVQVHQGFLV